MSVERPNRLTLITIDDVSIGRGTPDQEHERAVAIWDIVETNSFTVPEHPAGPYTLRLGMVDNKLAFEIRTVAGEGPMTHYLSLASLRRIIKDYGLICQSYYDAIRTASPEQIEAIDMGRRSLHNDGAELLRQRLANKVDLDFDTARRIFTLIYALHWKG